jgi:hypothetical protein
MQLAMNKNGIGFLTFAQNTSQVDYLSLAYIQACNIKSLHREFQTAVIVDRSTNNEITESCREVFDHIIVLSHDFNKENSTCKMANECQVFELTPFKETIKLESDLLFTRSISHWLSAFRLKDVFLSTGCKNYRQELSNVRTYRQFFDQNELPDIYNGLMYFRYSTFAQKFFYLARQILDNWDYLKEYVLKNCWEDTPSTDVLYAITAKIIGIENCTVPSCNHINFVHMKPAIQGWSSSGNWQNMAMIEFSDDMIRINNLNQYDPVHYYEKNFITPERKKYYEQRYLSIRTTKSI